MPNQVSCWLCANILPTCHTIQVEAEFLLPLDLHTFDTYLKQSLANANALSALPQQVRASSFILGKDEDYGKVIFQHKRLSDTDRS